MLNIKNNTYIGHSKLMIERIKGLFVLILLLISMVSIIVLRNQLLVSNEENQSLKEEINVLSNELFEQEDYMQRLLNNLNWITYTLQNGVDGEEYFDIITLSTVSAVPDVNLSFEKNIEFILGHIDELYQENEDYQLQIIGNIEEIDHLNLNIYELENKIEFLNSVLSVESNTVVADMNDLRVLSNASESQLNMLLQNTRLADTGWYFLEAEKQHNVNAIAMMSIMRKESQLGNFGNLWRQNNFAGISNGRGGWARFETQRDGIFALARLLDENYLSPGQRWYNGAHIEGVQTRYAPLSDSRNATWAPHIRIISNSNVNRINDYNT